MARILKFENKPFTIKDAITDDNIACYYYAKAEDKAAFLEWLKIESDKDTKKAIDDSDEGETFDEIEDSWSIESFLNCLKTSKEFQEVFKIAQESQDEFEFVTRLKLVL